METDIANTGAMACELPQGVLRPAARHAARPDAHHDVPFSKRLMDKALALAILLAVLPLMAGIALALLLLEGRPVFYGHRRVGRGGRDFRCLKFRTMVRDADAQLAALLATDADARAEWIANRKLEHDPRISPLGAFLRRSSLDELPQLWNVLKGEMSLVGPRPVTEDEAVFYGENFALYKAVRPGVTGAWQVGGRNETTYDQRVAMDVAYVRGWSLRADLSILARTVGVVLSGRGAS